MGATASSSADQLFCRIENNQRYNLENFPNRLLKESPYGKVYVTRDGEKVLKEIRMRNCSKQECRDNFKRIKKMQ
jgi:hypothetical protein